MPLGAALARLCGEPIPLEDRAELEAYERAQRRDALRWPQAPR
jgi:hypothetical protein